MSRKLMAVLVLVAMLMSTMAGVGPTVSANGGSEVVAFDMVGSASQNLISYANYAPAFSSAGDGFGKYQRWVSSSIPYSLLDDSLSIYTGDNLGIIDESNIDEFFGATDTENDDNSGPVTAVWTFDVSGYDNLELSIDMGAMGDFESADFFNWTVAIDGGVAETVFASTVDEAGSQDYTLEGGSTYTLADPMLVDGVLLNNVLQTFTKAITGSGSELALTLTAQTDGGSEAMAFQNVSISGTPVGGSEVVAFDMVGSASQNLISYANYAPAFSSAGDGFGKYQRWVSSSIPYSLLDDSLSIYTGDNLGIIDESNIDEFFGATDTENDDNSGPVTAVWTFDVSGYDNLELSIDMGAMGDFESADFFNWTVAIDGGVAETVFASTVDEAGSQDYTLEGGSTYTLADPMLVDGVLLNNVLQTFTKAITGFGSELALTLTVQTDGGSEAMAFQNIVISAVSGGVNLPPTVVSTDPAHGAEYVDLDANIEIVFSEAVTATGDWFEFTCNSMPVPVVASGGPMSYTLDPISDLPSSSACTVTIFASQVADQGDLPLNMAEDYSFGFNTTSVCGDLFTPIYTVQGSSDASPFNGSAVSIEGVVTGDFQNNGEPDNGDLYGFYVQDPGGDGDLATSDGIFVYDGSSPAVDVAVGDAVRVRGTVDEYDEMTEITSVGLVLVCGTGSVGPTVVDLPVEVDLEPYEGMLVTFPEELTASQNYFQGRYGQVTMSSDGRMFNPTNIYRPLTPEALALAADNWRRMFILDDGTTSQNPDPIPYIGADDTLRAGDTVAGLTGIVDCGPINSSYDLYYRLQPTGPVEFTRVNERTAEPDDVGGTVKVASFNVLNYFNGDGMGGGFPTSRGADSPEEFVRQRDKIIAAIIAMDADVIGLMEIENDGYDEYSAIADLVNGLNDVPGAGTYAFIDPSAPVGTDEIAVGMIYETGAVTPMGTAVLDDPAFTDPVNYGDQQSRPALAQTFMDNATGGVFTAVVNHLKSKSCYDYATGDDKDLGDGQSCFNETRTLGAQALVNWLATDPTGSGDPDFFIIGDLNSYAMEDPIIAIEDLGYTNLVKAFAGLEAYSYIFDGLSGYLDHALGTAQAVSRVTGATIWHINTDEPSVIDYNVEYKPEDLYTPTPYRSSDHDPVVVGLCTDEIAPTATVSVDPDTLWPPNHKYVIVHAWVDAEDNFDHHPTVTLVSVTSNQPDEGLGDGDLPDDIVILGDHTFKLRAERMGGDEDRVYTITYKVTDACGNETIATAEVTVPHDMGN